MSSNPFYPDFSMPSVVMIDNETLAKHCRDSFETFVKIFWDYVPGFSPISWNWHMVEICRTSQEAGLRVFAGKPKEHDIALNVPPGSSKSTLCSILFPVWVWINMPAAKVITASHTDSLVLDLANKSRAVIESDKFQQYFPYVQLKKDQKAKGDYANTKGGERKCCTVSGRSPTGRHAHFIIIDDPLDPKKAISEAELKNARHFLTEVIPSRKMRNPPNVAVTILIMQRVRINDPTDVMLERNKLEYAGKVKHLCIPCDDSWDIQPPELKRYYTNDGLMDPERLPRSTLKEFEATMGSYAFAGQFGQKPTPLGGGMFKESWFTKRVPSAPYAALRIIGIDRAACLIAGTEVETMDGPKAIETIEAGEYVRTRSGYRKVLWSGVSGFVNDLASVLFSNGSVVTGTLDHPVWDDRLEEWVDLSALNGDSCNIGLVSEKGEERCRINAIRSFFKEWPTIGMKEDDIMTVIQTRKDCESRTVCTERYGNSIEEIFPLAIKFITRTETGITIRLRILNASLQQNITEFMESSNGGTRLKKPRLSEIETEDLPTLTLHFDHMYARNAVRNSGRKVVMDYSSSVQKYAVCDIVLDIMRNSARYATSYFGADLGRLPAPRSAPSSIGVQPVQFARKFLRRDNQHKLIAAKVAEPLENGLKGVPVFDLQVEDEHEFFANDVLVHNTGEGGCFTAIMVMVDARQVDGFIYVERMVRGQWEPDERDRIILRVAQEYRARYGPSYTPRIVIESESGSTGKQAFQALVRMLAGFNVSEHRVSGSKDVRAEPWASQLSAGNVRLVDDGTWDVEAYIQEHLMFRPDPTIKRLGKYKDQVDASSLCFNLLANAANLSRFRVIGGPRMERGKFGIWVCTHEQLTRMQNDEVTALILKIADPDIDGYSNGHLERYGFDKLIDSCVVKFTDHDPKDLQANWYEPVQPYNKKPEDLIMNQEHASAIWKFLRKKRETKPEVWVIADQGDRRAASIAQAICRVLSLEEKTTIHYQLDEDVPNYKPTINHHVVQCMRSVRSMV